jgi:hypothetical protein
LRSLRSGRPLRLIAVKRLIVACLLLPSAAPAVETIGIVTMQEGGASLLRGTSRYAVAEGVRLIPGDILELADKAFSQVEFADGSIVALGPQSRFLALSYPPPGARSSGGELFLLRGWMKLASAPQKGRAIERYGSPLFELNPDGTAVVQVSAPEAAVFMESGEGRLAQVSANGRAGDSVRLKTSQFFTCKQDQRGSVAPRPSPSFLGALPRSFMDTLPARAAKFKERNVAPKRSGDFTYAEVQDWINSVPAVRRAMVSHWQSKLADPAFRSAIAAGLKEHPEWDRLINPDKYQDAAATNRGGQPQLSGNR